MPLLKTLTENETLNFINKEELEENSIYSLNHAQYIMTHANYFELQISAYAPWYRWVHV